MQFKQKDLELFWNNPAGYAPSRVPRDVRRSLYRKLQMLDAACQLAITSRPSKGSAKVSTAFGSIDSGGFVLRGFMARRKELSSVTTINEIVSTPGEILREEFLEPLGISQYRLAKAIGKPQSAISDIVHGRRAITPEMAWLLGKALGTTAQFWLNLENAYQLKTIDESALPNVTVLAR